MRATFFDDTLTLAADTALFFAAARHCRYCHAASKAMLPPLLTFATHAIDAFPMLIYARCRALPALITRRGAMMLYMMRAYVMALRYAAACRCFTRHIFSRLWRCALRRL